MPPVGPELRNSASPTEVRGVSLRAITTKSSEKSATTRWPPASIPKKTPPPGPGLWWTRAAFLGSSVGPPAPRMTPTHEEPSSNPTSPIRTVISNGPSAGFPLRVRRWAVLMGSLPTASSRPPRTSQSCRRLVQKSGPAHGRSGTSAQLTDKEVESDGPQPTCPRMRKRTGRRRIKSVLELIRRSPRG